VTDVVGTAAVGAVAGEAVPGRAMHRLFGVYSLVSGVALAFPYRPAAWPVLAALHIAAAWLALRPHAAAAVGAALETRWPRVMRVLADWYPLLLIPALYTELAILNKAVFDGHYFDPIIQGWEEAIFGGQPSRELARAYPVLPLSETLHAAYLSYYFIIYGPPLILYLTGRFDDFRRVTFGVMLTFFVHYLFFIYFPVQGPRYLFPAPGGEIAAGAFYKLAHRVLEAGSSQGAAFPSSHVGVAFAQSVLALRYLPRLAPFLFVLSTALALGAIYGGFHYATDAVAGLVLGVAVVAAAPALIRRLGV